MRETQAEQMKLVTTRDSKYFIPHTNGGYSKYVNERNAKTHSLLPNCTSGAYGIAMQFMQTTDYTKVDLAKANAKDWYKYSGWKKSKFPVVGAIACWTNDAKGHVAVVREVTRNSHGDATAVKTLESSYYGYNKQNWREGYTYKYNATTGTLTKSGYKFQGYLLCPNIELDPVVKERLQVGDKVEIIGKGNSRKDGKGKTSGGIGFKRQILKIYPTYEFPYQVGNAKGTVTGYYKASALKRL